MTAAELFQSPPSLFALPFLDVERAKQMYLAQFGHTCGGKPVAYQNEYVTCSGCSYKIKACQKEPLGVTIGKSEFRSLILA